MNVRPHHALCAQFFVGKGYSDAFVDRMYRILSALGRDGAEVTLTDGCDAICEACPHNLCGVCETEEKVGAIDRRALAATGLSFGDTLSWRELSARITDRILAQGRLSDVCRNCEWIDLCKTIEAKNADLPIRLAVPQDEPRIRALFIEMLRSVSGADDAQGYEPGYLDKFFRGGEDRIYVCGDGDPVAYLSVEVYREPRAYVYLDDLSVTEAYRGRGIGTRLIRAAESYAKEIGIETVVFHVNKTNRGAFRLYERLGYAVYRDDGTRYLMKK